jgi:uncharacterized protein
MAVTPWGDLYPCHQFVGDEKFKLGSIFTGLDNPEVQSEFASCNVYAKPECRDCWAKYYCSGGCNANNYIFNGDILDSYDIACGIQKKRLESAILMKILEMMKEK